MVYKYCAFIKCNIGSFFVYKNPNSVIKKFNLRVNSCSVFRIQFISMKLFLLLSLLFVTSLPVNADISLYERGKDLIEEKDYEKALKAFELAAKMVIWMQCMLLELCILVVGALNKMIKKGLNI